MGDIINIATPGQNREIILRINHLYDAGWTNFTLKIPDGWRYIKPFWEFDEKGLPINVRIQKG